MIRCFVVLFLTAIAVSSHANDRWYGGVQFGGYTFEWDDDPLEFDPKAAGLLVGFMAYKYLGVEIRGGAGLGTNKKDYSGYRGEGDIGLEMDYYASLYFRPQYRFKYATVYGLIGYSETQFKADLDGDDIDVGGAEQGFSYGLGVGFTNSDRVSFVLEYINVVDADDYSLSGTNFSVQFYF